MMSSTARTYTIGIYASLECKYRQQDVDCLVLVWACRLQSTSKKYRGGTWTHTSPEVIVDPVRQRLETHVTLHAFEAHRSYRIFCEALVQLNRQLSLVQYNKQ